MNPGSHKIRFRSEVSNAKESFCGFPRSKAAEKRLADRLSARGFKVYGGH